MALLKGLLIEHVDEDIRAVRISVTTSVDRANAAYFFTISETRRCDFFWFGSNDMIKVVAATNRPDVLDPALLRSGRLDRKIELPCPPEEARAKILRIHSRKMSVRDDVAYGELARGCEDFNGAQLKAVCVEAGMLALRGERTEVVHEDFVEAIAVVAAKKKGSLDYFA